MAGGSDGWPERIWRFLREAQSTPAAGSNEQGVRVVSDQLTDIHNALSQIMEQNERIIEQLNQITEYEDD